MTEKQMAKQVCKLMRRYHAIRVENACAPGCPDIYTTLGWIELKSGNGQLRPSQKAWIAAELAAGGQVIVITYDRGLYVVNLLHARGVETIQYHDNLADALRDGFNIPDWRAI